MLSIKNINFEKKNVLIRVDFNVPIQNNKIVSTLRIDASLKTIKYVLKNNASRIILISHLGNPIEGSYDEEFSLFPIKQYLSEKLNKQVVFEKNYLNEYKHDTTLLDDQQIILCENVRFNIGEKKCDSQLSKQLSNLCDIVIMEAFATIHRIHASTYGILKYSKTICAGFLLEHELNIINNTLNNPKKPLISIVGGSKISTKINLLENMLKISDYLIIGGGIANTFLMALGYNIGKSLKEEKLLNIAKSLIKRSEENKSKIILPIDVRVGNDFTNTTPSVIKSLTDIKSNEIILDIGPQSESLYSSIIKKSKTILWNGPVGVFEFDNFSKGTYSLATIIAKTEAFSLAGGGDTIRAIEKFNIKKYISYISTGGGSFLNLIEGKELKILELLKQHNKKKEL